eukprot:scaffold14073_cov62-Isochrysis_galbana.AAC.1
MSTLPTPPPTPTPVVPLIWWAALHAPSLPGRGRVAGGHSRNHLLHGDALSIPPRATPPLGRVSGELRPPTVFLPWQGKTCHPLVTLRVGRTGFPSNSSLHRVFFWWFFLAPTG